MKFTLLVTAFIAFSGAIAGNPTTNENTKLIENTGFKIGYSESRKNPIWVSYKLFKVEYSTSDKRPSGFKVDERTESKVKHKDYTRTGYDRGHMAPNYAIATRYGREAQLQTFLMSNICPQKPKLNRQVWKRLEQLIANKYANELDTISVVTGPIFDEDIDTLLSGVEIPNAFYKIVKDMNNRMLPFIMAQDVAGNEEYGQFLVSVDSIESVTDIDFFSELEDALEDSLEVIVPIRMWE